MSIDSCITIFQHFEQLSFNVNLSQTILYMCIAIITVIVNLLLILAMVGSKQVWSNSSNVLITFMSCVDFINGLMSMPFLAIVRLKRLEKDMCSLKNASQIILVFLAYQSTFIVIMIAIDRYLHMRTTFAKRRSAIMKIFSGKWIILPILCATVLSAAISAIPMILSKLGNTGIIITLVLVTLTKCVFIIGIAILYIRGYLKIREFVRNNPVYNDSACLPQTNKDSSNNSRVSSKTTRPPYLRSLQKTVYLLIIALLACYVPYTFAATARTIFLIQGKESMALLICYDITIFIYFCNFSINSLIVLKMNKKARSWLAKKIKCCRIDENEDISMSNESKTDRSVNTRRETGF